MDFVQDNINSGDYWRIIKSRKMVIVVFFFTIVSIVTVSSFLMKPVYRSTASLLIDIESPKVLTTTGNVALGGQDYYAYKEYFQSQREIVRSRSIASQIFDEFDLGDTEDYIKSKDPIKAFLKTVTVEPVRDTRLLLLNVDNKDPQLAADIANRIAEVYVDRNLSYITKSEVINLLKNEYLKLQTKLSEYSKTYKDGHPKMIRLKQEIDQTVAMMKEEKERVGDYDMAKSTAYDVSGTALFGLKANNISIQDRAEPSKIPIRPKKRLNILLAIIVGLFGGAGMAFFLEYVDDTVKSIEDIERAVSWPFLGNVPKMGGKDKTSHAERDLFVKNNPKDPASEAYRAIRTSVIFSSTKEKPLGSIIITSPGPREGKTTTLCNLGIAMAQSQKKVLLVDADMRKPRLHSIFKSKNDAGLSSFLSGQAEFGVIVQKTEIENLSLVSGGTYPPNPSELLTSHRMKEFIDNAKGKFDIVLLDTPPIAVVTDALILSKVTDGMIIVIESGTTGRRALHRINQMLNDAGARIVGVVFNKISATHSGYYYSYYYGKNK